MLSNLRLAEGRLSILWPAYPRSLSLLPIFSDRKCRHHRLPANTCLSVYTARLVRPDRWVPYLTGVKGKVVPLLN
jgi:hypothetical protein